MKFLKRVWLFTLGKIKWVLIMLIFPVGKFIIGLLRDDIVTGYLNKFAPFILSILEFTMNNSWSWPFGALAIVILIGVIKSLSDINWDEVAFIPWNSLITVRNLQCGIKIYNGKDEDIEECFADLIGYRLAYGDGSIFSVNAWVFPPLKLYWIVENELCSENITIHRETGSYLGIAFEDDPSIKVNGVTTGIKGINFELKNAFTDIKYVDVRISGKVKGKSMRPKKLLIKTEEKDSKVKVLEIKNG